MNAIQAANVGIGIHERYLHPFCRHIRIAARMFPNADTL
jgi:hypothetical protein